MKLQRLLETSIYEKNDAKELAGLFKRDVFRNDIHPLMYRGYGEDIERWKIFSIRKDRKPKDTASFVDKFIYHAEEEVDKDVPKRRESKFGTTSQTTASKYGSVYIAFPEPSSNVVHLPQDSYKYFNDISNAVIEFEREFHSALFYDENFTFFDDDPEFKEFLKNVIKMHSGAWEDESIYKSVADDVINRPDWIKEKVEYYSERYKGRDYLKLLYYDFVKPVNRYFKEMKKGVNEKVASRRSGGDEIIFDGNQYIMIEEKFFNKFFSWNGNVWEPIEGLI